MKPFIALILFVFVFQGCTKDEVTAKDVAGSWKITSYVDNNNRDRTSRFSSYTFDFLDSGEFQVKTGTTLYKKGTWSNGSSYWTSTIVIAIANADGDLTDLNEDWRIQEKSTTTIKLKNGGGKNLVFTK